MYLSEAASRAGRRNNFNLIRLMAALSVLVSHSFALATGDPKTEPFAESLGITLGSLAVVVFFITSGFLVGGSLLTRGQPARFVASRFVRIYPALILVVVLTAVVIGPLVTTLSVPAYFARSGTWRYIAINGTSIFAFDYLLPGVFTHNPYWGTVNGALWTLRFELWMYSLLLVAWLATAARGMAKAFATIVALLIVAGLAHYWHRPELTPDVASGLGKLSWLTPMFFLGVGAHLLRAHFPLRWSIAAGAAALLIASAIAGPPFFKAAYPFCLTYLVLFIVYATPSIEWVQHRDYSYGIYIYGFLVQQVLASQVPHISVLAMLLAAFAITTALAVASWRLIEKPALAKVDAATLLLQGAIRRTRRRRAPAV